MVLERGFVTVDRCLSKRDLTTELFNPGPLA